MAKDFERSIEGEMAERIINDVRFMVFRDKTPLLSEASVDIKWGRSSPAGAAACVGPARASDSVAGPYYMIVWSEFDGKAQ